MKAAFTISVLLVFSWSAMAQITLNSDNVLHSPDLLDLRFITNLNIAIPEEGGDMLYDYSSFPTDDQIVTEYFPAENAAFETSTRYFLGSPTLGPIILSSEYYSGISPEGLFRSGSYLRPQKETLLSFTGNVNDSINFPGTYSIFEEPDYELKFPTNYGDSWSNSFQFITETELSVAAFGLNDAPVTNVQFGTRDVEVVGWGQLIIPSETGGPSVPYDVLLVKDVLTYIDSFFMGPNPAPGFLLDAFGLTQGATFSINYYHFYAAGFDGPLLEIRMNSNFTAANFAVFRNNNVISNTTDNFDLVQSKVYPNPLTPNQQLHIEVEAGFLPTSITFFDRSGKMVYQTEEPHSIGGVMKVDLPIGLSPGMYLYNLKDRDNKLSSTGSVVIH